MTPLWTWCPMAGAGMIVGLGVDANEYGDGFIHQKARGINTVRRSWALSFPFVDRAGLKAMDDFLRAYALDGFWFLPPTSTAEVFATCDDWNSTVLGRVVDGEMTGQLQATFVRSFTPTGGPDV